MMRKTSVILLSAATGAALTLFVTQPRAVMMGSSARAATSDTYRQLNLFGDVFERVRSDYVEKPDDSKLVESAISGMLTGLDPHSSYMDAKSFRDMQVQTRGEFGWLGIEVTMEDGLIKVVSPIDDTPASKAGIMANDIITTLDDEAVQGLTLNQAVEKMRGPVNTKIRLKIVRKGQDNPIEVTLVRDNIRVRSVRARTEGDDIGYIRITTFNEQTTEGLKREIANLSTQIGDKLKGYIIDLRNNPGGLLEEAVTVSAAFQQSAGIIAQVDDVALQLVADLRAEIGDFPLQAFGGLFIERGDADIADIVAFGARAHRADTDVVAHQRDLNRVVLTLANDLQPDLGIDRPAHFFDGLIKGQALHRFVVESGDDVVGHDAGLGRRRIIDRGDDLDQSVFHRDFDAEPAEFAAGLHLHVAEALGIHVARMRIEAGQHSADGRFDELAVVGFLDVVAADPFEHIAEQIELAIGVRGRRAGTRSHQHRAGLGDEQRQCRAGGGTQENYRSLAHHPRTFSPSFAAHHGPGSIGVPSLRNST